MKFREFPLEHDEKFGWVITRHSDNQGTPRLRELEEAGLVTCTYDELGVWVWHLTPEGVQAMREEYSRRRQAKRSKGRGGQHRGGEMERHVFHTKEGIGYERKNRTLHRN